VRTRIRLTAVAAGLCLAGAGLLAGATTSSASTGHVDPPIVPKSLPHGQELPQRSNGSPADRTSRIKTLEAAEARIQKLIKEGRPYYGFIDLRDIYAYNLPQLWNQDIDGYGTSVAVIEGWNLPGIQKTIDQLDAQVGLPNPVIQTVYPSGPLPKQCPPGMVKLGSYGSCDAWGGELTLDVLTVHMFAPYAKIVISATPSDSETVEDTSSQVAPPEMMHALEYLGAHHLANVISISDGSSETDYSRGANEITAQDPGALTAAADGIPVVNATGDCGSAQNLSTATSQCGTLSAGPAVATWDDSPWVTAVGGDIPPYRAAQLHQKGFILDPIEGAGFSEIYQRPAFQDSVARITGSRQRSVPDITMDSASGTSQAAPGFAGVLALATQLRGGNLGPINEVLYDVLGRHPARNGLVDITSGNDAIGSIPGFSAAPGWDVASGWGTVDASRFVPALVRAVDATPPSWSMAARAAAQLRVLERRIALTPSDRIGLSDPLEVMSGGFLPDHPVGVWVDGRRLSTVVADASGDINVAFVPSVVKLRAGRHTVTLVSMLIDKSAGFVVTG
jgi:hypothetical protein